MRNFEYFMNDSNPAGFEDFDKIVNAVPNLKTRNEPNAPARHSRGPPIPMEHQGGPRSGEFKVDSGNSADWFETERVSIKRDRPIQVLDVEEQPSSMEQERRRVICHSRPATEKVLGQ